MNIIKWQRVHKIDEMMNVEDVDWLQVCRELKNSAELHYAITEFNWDDELDFPSAVLSRPECDLGTILLMFEMIDEEPEFRKFNYKPFEQHVKPFSIKLRAKWESKDYPSNISYDGSPGSEIKAEWKAKNLYSHYEMYPDEKPGDA